MSDWTEWDPDPVEDGGSWAVDAATWAAIAVATIAVTFAASSAFIWWLITRGIR